MTTATKPITEQLAALDDAEKREAYENTYLRFVRTVASDEPMDVDDANELRGAMKVLGYSAALFTPDVEVLRDVARLTLLEVNHNEEDADDAKLLQLLQQRAERRAKQKPATRRHVPATVENLEAAIAKADERAALRGKIIELLKDVHFVRVNSNGTLHIGGTLSASLKEIKAEGADAAANLKILKLVQQCNPRLFAGDFSDTREAWPRDRVSAAMNEEPGRGGAVFMASRTSLDARLRERDEQAEQTKAPTGWDVFRR